jgi:hypothetical protein
MPFVGNARISTFKNIQTWQFGGSFTRQLLNLGIDIQTEL